MITLHLVRIAATLPYAIAQDNNHGTSEAAALFIGGAWLDATGSIVWTTAFVGNIDSNVSINDKLSIIGYSLLSSDFTLNASQQLIIESSASMYVNSNLSIY